MIKNKNKDNSINLYVNILKQAMLDIISKNPGIRTATYKWIKEYDPDNDCSFNNICGYLGLNYDDMLDLFLNKKLKSIPNIKKLLKNWREYTKCMK